MPSELSRCTPEFYRSPRAIIGIVVRVERLAESCEDLVRLIGELDAELAAHYSAEQRHGLNISALFAPGVSFYLARLDEKAVGCGGVAVMDGFGEVKRMYVSPDARGAGVADAVLAELEATCVAQRISLLRLETGVHQQAAIRFYERCGFVRCEPFPPYTQMTPEAISTSVFMEKPLPGS